MLGTGGQSATTFRMRPADAMWFWMAANFGVDQFMAYAFAGRPRSMDDAVDAALGRARRSPFLTLRVRESPLGVRYPLWVPGEVRREQFTVSDGVPLTWQGVLDSLADLMRQRLDPRVTAWRAYVFSPVHGVPGCAEEATVVVTRIPHALGDGARSAALAASLFGRAQGPVGLDASPTGTAVRRAVVALRAHRALNRDTRAGRIPAARAEVPALSTNTRPSERRVLRTLVRPVAALPGPTPTVGALIAVGEALAGYLRARGEDTSQLTAGVPIARSGVAQAFNHIDTALVGLHTEVAARHARIPLIAADLVSGKRRSEHPAFTAREHVAGMVPAGVRSWVIRRTDFAKATSSVPGHTVVSSVDRGAADLEFGGCPVLFTAGYPILLPICNLAHGVHVLGDTVAVSVHATSDTDVDEYVERLASAIDG